MAKVSVTVDTRKLDNILKHLDGNVAKAVETAALAVEARAKLKAPVDTGALRASIYVEMKRSSGFPQARSEVKGRNAEVDAHQLPVPREEMVAHVGPSVEYGMEIELGSSKRAGTPYLQPAVRETEEEFRKLLGKAVKNE